MPEYWVNIYPHTSDCSHPLSEQLKHDSREASIRAAELYSQFFGIIRPAYRIRVKMKEPRIKMFVTGDCGKVHTLKEWQTCKVCRNTSIRYRNSFVWDN